MHRNCYLETKCKGNFVAEVLSGDMRQGVKSTYGRSGTRITILDGLTNLGVSKFNYMLWMFSVFMLGINGQITPSLTQVVAGGTTVFNLVTAQVAPVIGWIASTDVPDTAVPSTANAVKSLADEQSNIYTSEFQFTPCGYQAEVLMLNFNVVQTGAGANSCILTPGLNRAGQTYIQNGGAFAVGGQVPAQTITFNTTDGTAITLDFLSLTSPDIQQILQGSADILSDGIAPTIVAKVRDHVLRGQELAFDATAKKLQQRLPQWFEKTPEMIKMVDDSLYGDRVFGLSGLEEVNRPQGIAVGEPHPVVKRLSPEDYKVRV